MFAMKTAQPPAPTAAIPIHAPAAEAIGASTAAHLDNHIVAHSHGSNGNTTPESPIKVHTCGSRFAKCGCESTTAAGDVRTTDSASASTASSRRDSAATGSTFRRKTLFQSYSHPDTSFVFTDDNRNPQRIAAAAAAARAARAQSTVTRTKRMSTPCAPGTYSVLSVAVHPDLMLAMSHQNGRIEPISTETVTTALGRQPRASILKKTSTVAVPSGGSTASPAVRRVSGLHRERTTSERITTTTSNSNEYLKYIGGASPALDEECTSSSDERRDSFRTDAATAPSAAYNRRESRSLGDPSRVEQLRQYAMRKQSECNETEYLRQQRQRTADLEAETARLKQTIADRDNEIHKLKREIHKLKSVLQQTAAQPQSSNGDLLSSLQTHHRMPGQQSLVLSTANSHSNTNLNALHISSSGSSGGSQSNNNNNNGNSSPNVLPAIGRSPLAGHSNSTPNITASVERPLSSAGHALSALPPHMQLSVASTAVKKQGVSGESSDTTGHQLSRDILIPKHDKDFGSKQLIKEAILDNDFLKNLDSSQVRELVDSMYGLEMRCGEFVIKEGDAGAHLYVSARGEFEVIQAGTVLGRMGEGKAFGELAILYNCTRTASIKVVADARLWVLDRRVFQAIMMRTGLQRIEENISFLRSVPLLQHLSRTLLAKIADVLEVEFYPAGTYVIRQGASGATFFLISQGEVKVTQRLAGDGATPAEEEEIRTLRRGDYFGEQALIKEDKRTANVIAMAPGVECLTLDRESFAQLIGDLCELREKDYGDESRVLAMKRCESRVRLFGAGCEAPAAQEHLDIGRQDLQVVATLGVGGFGRVELVQHVRREDGAVRSFALKCLKKQHIVDTRQQEHVFSERTIMLACRSPFICRLYRTYRDAKYVYMLLEACMGGEVWTILRDRGYFDDACAQFVIGSVLQAFEYLHQLGIVYRDLKPENLMLDERGYVKLVDFGFSKYIGYSGKTWTFCGTPEYVAPEIILNKGHDRAVDYWALGILIHELLTGSPPFVGQDPMKTYNIILKGIDMVDFPKHMSRSAVQLIKKLCRDIPTERLGYQRSGTEDIRKHKWFQNFDWDGLANQTMEPPIVQPVSGPLDTCNFDEFDDETLVPPDEESGWDHGF